MGYRAAPWMGLYAVLWTLLAVSNLWLNDFRYHIPLTSIITGIIFGSIFGLAIGAIVTLKQLQTLMRKGETHVSLTTWLFVTGVFFVFLALITYAVANESITALATASNFLFPTVPAVAAARTVFFVSWEGKNKKTIFSRSVSTLYTMPKTEKVT
jgi:predicted transporter